MNESEIERAIVSLCRRHRNYKAYSAYFNVVEKVWNHGMGAIGFIRVYKERGILAVNRLFYNRTDERKIEELKKMLKGTWKIVWCEYGYPSFYNHSFSLKFAVND